MGPHFTDGESESQSQLAQSPAGKGQSWDLEPRRSLQSVLLAAGHRSNFCFLEGGIDGGTCPQIRDVGGEVHFQETGTDTLIQSAYDTAVQKY